MTLKQISFTDIKIHIKAGIKLGLHVVKNLPYYTRKTIRVLIIFTTFFMVLLFFISSLIFKGIRKVPFMGRLFDKLLPFWQHKGNKIYTTLSDRFESLRPFKVKRNYLIFISYQNLLMRRSRSMITILGMSVGVGIIVFLLSLGYGIERLVISQVASLEELQIIDVNAGESSTASLNTDVINKIRKMPEVEKTLPMITVVGRLDYKNAQTDIVVYAVPAEFFNASRQVLLKGQYLQDSKDTARGKEDGTVAGEETQLVEATMGQPISNKKLDIQPVPGELVPVWKSCSLDAELLGNTIRIEGANDGVEFWGSEYSPFDPFGRVGYDRTNQHYLGVWVQGEFPLFIEDEAGNTVPELKNALPRWEKGCTPKKYLQTKEKFVFIGSGDVLGEATASADLTASSEADLDEDFVSFLADAEVATNEAGVEVVTLKKAETTTQQEKVLPFKKPVSGNAIMSSGLMNLLNLSTDKAVKEKFSISYIIIKSLMPSISGRILTSKAEYNVLGVVEDDDNQFIYVPLDDLVNLGIDRFSQVKLVLRDQNNMSEIRKSIESLGYKTTSTSDTVTEIETFFTTLRAVLGILGFIALGVASLGMFNTLTVSLLERTREIGGMKTMGMVSGEIQELFLAEAMIMGFSGGIGGLLLGFTVGKLLSYSISLISITQGVGYLELTYIPIHLVLFIILCSFIVGVITGWYPAHRAQKISALNALRYE